MHFRVGLPGFWYKIGNEKNRAPEFTIPNLTRTPHEAVFMSTSRSKSKRSALRNLWQRRNHHQITPTQPLVGTSRQTPPDIGLSHDPAMADNASRLLLCLMEHDTAIFPVEVSTNNNVFVLKNSIFEICKRDPLLRDVSPKDLVVWKVSHF